MQFKPLIFVTGKGGVGKSVIAAALATGLSRQGKRILLVEFAEKSFYEKFFHSQTITFQPKQIAPNLSVSLWDYVSCLREYVGFYVKTDKIFDLFFSNQVVQKFLQAAPTLKELALLGKATSQPRKVGPHWGYDHIIVDSYSSGHHKALLKAPFGMSQVVHRGPMGAQSQSMIQVLQDPKYTQHLVVLKPEEMPVVEGLELQKSLKAQFGVDSELICNQVYQYPFQNQDLVGTDEMSQFFLQEKITQDSYVDKLRETACFVNYHFDKKDRFEFLQSIYEDLARPGR